MYVLELVNDYQSRVSMNMKRRRTKVFYAKLVALLGGLTKVIALTLWVTHRMDDALLLVVSFALFQVTFMLATLSWFELIEGTKHIWTDMPPHVVICKRIVLVGCVLMTLPVVCHASVLYGGLTQYVLIGSILLLLLVPNVVAIMTLIYLCRTRTWIIESGPKLGKYRMVARKTYLLIALSSLVALLGTLYLATHMLPGDLLINLILSRFALLCHESVNGVLMYLFLENGIKGRYSAIRALIRSTPLSPPNDTP